MFVYPRIKVLHTTLGVEFLDARVGSHFIQECLALSFYEVEADFVDSRSALFFEED